MLQPPRIHLFQGYGVELEYMLVDRDTLQIKPVADQLLKEELGEYGSDFENGIVTWSNELVLHVVELKSTRPESNFTALESAFVDNIRRINTILSKWNAMLIPTAAHPFMDPSTETKLWPHDSNEVYEIYNRIFNCKGHGWSNLQSTHLNLPFYDDEEFAKLHSAIRLLLPLLPAICASSPILDGKLTGQLDTRLMYYKSNQAKIPCITGKVIPEAVFSKRNYFNTIYDKIKHDISGYDPEQILNPIWVNSRGAIPRFDRGSIEIRIMDIQECPRADLAIVSLVVETIKLFVQGEFIDHEEQMKWKTEVLAALFDKVVEKGPDVVIDQPEYLSVFDFPGKSAKVGELWQHIIQQNINSGNSVSRYKAELDVIIKQGTLSQRIIRVLNGDYSRDRIIGVYKKLGACLEQNRMLTI